MRFASFFLTTVLISTFGCGKSNQSVAGHKFDTQSRMLFINKCSTVTDPEKQNNTEYIMTKRKLCTCAMERIETTMSFQEYQASVLSRSFMGDPRLRAAFEGCTSTYHQKKFGEGLYEECVSQLKDPRWPEDAKSEICRCVSEKTEKVISAREVKKAEHLRGILLENMAACGQERPEIMERVRKMLQTPVEGTRPEGE